MTTRNNNINHDPASLAESWAWQIIHSETCDIYDATADEAAAAMVEYIGRMGDEYVTSFRLGESRWLDTKDRNALNTLIKDARQRKVPSTKFQIGDRVRTTGPTFTSVHEDYFAGPERGWIVGAIWIELDIGITGTVVALPTALTPQGLNVRLDNEADVPELTQEWIREDASIPEGDRTVVGFWNENLETGEQDRNWDNFEIIGGQA